MFVSAVHPVATLSALFWMICSLLVCVCASTGDHTVLAYSSSGRVNVLYVFVIVSFSFPQLVDVKVLMILVDCLALSVMLVMCLL